MSAVERLEHRPGETLPGRETESVHLAKFPAADAGRRGSMKVPRPW